MKLVTVMQTRALPFSTDRFRWVAHTAPTLPVTASREAYLVRRNICNQFVGIFPDGWTLAPVTTSPRPAVARALQRLRNALFFSIYDIDHASPPAVLFSPSPSWFLQLPGSRPPQFAWCGGVVAVLLA